MRLNRGRISNGTAGGISMTDLRGGDGGGARLIEPNAEFMPEAEVTLRLAFWLLDQADADDAAIAIDGAHVYIRAHEQSGRRVEEQVVFDIKPFLAAADCEPESLADAWRGTYRRRGKTLTIRSVSGFDVTVKIGRNTVVAECKGGPLKPTKGKSVAAVFASAIGQVVTCSTDAQPNRLLIAVPDSPAFERGGKQILRSAVFQKIGIEIALVGRQDVRILKSPH